MNPMYANAFCEIVYILDNMDDTYTRRIPEKLRQFFYQKQSKYYEIKLTTNIPLQEQELLEETRAILAFLCRKYLCEENVRRELEENFQNELKKEMLARQAEPKKEVKNIFTPYVLPSDNPTQENVNTLPQIYEKGTWYKKIINKIKEILKK